MIYGKGYLGLIGMMAGMANMAYGDNWDEPLDKNFRPIKTETNEFKKLRLAQHEIKRHKANGLKEFVYGKNSLWSRDLKNADRKAHNKGWL